MNILEAEDLVKGMPDDYLMQQAKMPDGQVPQYLLISEIQRRTDMRKRFQNEQQQMPEGTVADKIMSEGIASVTPQQGAMPPQSPPAAPPPQGMAGGGIIHLAGGGQANYAPAPQNENLRLQVQGAISNMFSDMPQQYAAGGPVNNNFDPIQWAIQMSRAGRDRDEILDQLTNSGYLDEARHLMDTYGVDDRTNAFQIPPDISPPSVQAERYPNSPEANVGNVDLGITELLPDKSQTAPGDWSYQQGISSEAGGRDRVYDDFDPAFRALDALRGAVDIKNPTGIHWSDESKLEGGENESGWGDMIGDVSRKLYGGGMWDKVFGTVNDLLNGDPDNAAAMAEVAEQPEAPKVPGEQVKPLGTDPQVQARSTSAQVTGTGGNANSPLNTMGGIFGGGGGGGNAAEKLMDVYNRKEEAFPEFGDLIEDQRRSAWANAMMQMGAGIASGAKDLGLSKAGTAMSTGMEKARDLDAKARLGKYSASQKEVDRDIDILAKRAGIDVSSERTRISMMIQNKEDINSALRFAGGLAEQIVGNQMMSPEKRAFYVAKTLKQLLPEHVASQINLNEMMREYLSQYTETTARSFVPE